MAQQLIDAVYWANQAMMEQPSDESVVWPFGTAGAYLAILWVLRKWMQNKPEGHFDKVLRLPLIIHNFILSAFSFILVCGLVYRVYDVYFNCSGKLYDVYCGCSNNESKDDSFLWWAYLFYLSKYYELFDTVFLVLRKRPLTFLHVYHHAIVLPMCWYAINQGIIMGWITCFNNAFVHVIMYYYYGQQARGIKDIWWRK